MFIADGLGFFLMLNQVWPFAYCLKLHKEAFAGNLVSDCMRLLLWKLVY